MGNSSSYGKKIYDEFVMNFNKDAGFAKLKISTELIRANNNKCVFAIIQNDNDVDPIYKLDKCVKLSNNYKLPMNTIAYFDMDISKKNKMIYYHNDYETISNFEESITIIESEITVQQCEQSYSIYNYQYPSETIADWCFNKFMKYIKIMLHENKLRYMKKDK